MDKPRMLEWKYKRKHIHRILIVYNINITLNVISRAWNLGTEHKVRDVRGWEKDKTWAFWNDANINLAVHFINVLEETE